MSARSNFVRSHTGNLYYLFTHSIILVICWYCNNFS